MKTFFSYFSNYIMDSLYYQVLKFKNQVTRITPVLFFPISTKY